MRLLICTQAVDRKDPALSFFHRWIEEFAQRAEKVTVICLRKGDYDLPHVEVIALGEHGRVLRVIELLAVAFGRRRDYDAVFVHMNPEYLVAAGWLWRLMGKYVSLWYTHKSVDTMLRIGARYAQIIFTATKETFRLPSSKVVVMGHGIDTLFFTPGSDRRGAHLFSAGRLSPIKKHDMIIRAAALAGVPLRIAGDGPEKKSLQKLAKELGANVQFLGALNQEAMRAEYQSAAHFVHASETGGLDKVVLEAAACNCNVVTTVPWLHTYVSVTTVAATPEAIAEAVRMDGGDSVDRMERIRSEHALVPLIEKIVWKLSKNK